MTDYKNQLKEELARQNQNRQEFQVAVEPEPIEPKHEEIVGNKVVNQDTGEVVDRIIGYTLKLKGRMSDLQSLRVFMDAHNIQFEKVNMDEVF